MLKLFCYTLADLGTFVDNEGNNKIAPHELFQLQEVQGLNLGKKYSFYHLTSYKHKIIVRLVTQTLSSSVVDALEFLDTLLTLSSFFLWQ